MDPFPIDADRDRCRTEMAAGVRNSLPQTVSLFTRGVVLHAANCSTSRCAIADALSDSWLPLSLHRASYTRGEVNTAQVAIGLFSDPSQFVGLICASMCTAHCARQHRASPRPDCSCSMDAQMFKWIINAHRRD